MQRCDPLTVAVLAPTAILAAAAEVMMTRVLCGVGCMA